MTNWYYYIIALIPPFMSSISYVSSKYVIEDISPITLSFYRWLTALLILTPFSIRSFISEINNICSGILVIFIMAISGVTLFTFFVYTSLQYVSSTNASIIVSIFPLFVLFLGVLIDKQRLKKPQICSILCSFIGLLIIVSKGDIIKELSSLFNNIGDFIALVAAVCWAVYIFAAKFKPDNLSFSSQLYSVILIGTILILPLYLVDIFYFHHSFTINILNISVILILGIGVSIIGLLALNLSVIKIGADVSSILFYTAPLLTSMLAVMILGEDCKSFHLIGMIMILFGINIPILMRMFKFRNRVVSEVVKTEDNV